MKRICSYYIFFFLISVLVSCKNEPKDIYLIEGKIANLTSRELYVVTGASDSLTVDTVFCNKEGEFSYKGKSDTLSSVVIYMEKGKVWVTVWACNNQKITLSGDAVYPELVIAKGNEVNNLLSEFKEKNRGTIKEKRDLIDRRDTLRNTTDTSTVDVVKSAQYSSIILNLSYTLKDKAEAFVVGHPETLASLVLFYDYILPLVEPEDALQYLQNFKGDVSNYFLYKEILSDINDKLDRIKRTCIGSEAPDFSVVTLNKKDTLNLDSFSDKYLLLSFSASWCDFCSESHKEMVRIRKEIAKDKLGMLTIALDRDEGAWSRLAKKEKMDWNQAVDTLEWSSSIAHSYNINEIPANILIDKNRIIVGRDLPADSLILKLKAEN